MSCPDPLHDYEDFNMDRDTNYDDFNDFYPEEISAEDLENGWDDDEEWADDYDDSMDGDFDSGMASAGFGTDENYGYYGDDTPMFDDYYGGE